MWNIKITKLIVANNILRFRTKQNIHSYIQTKNITSFPSHPSNGLLHNGPTHNSILAQEISIIRLILFQDSSQHKDTITQEPILLLLINNLNQKPTKPHNQLLQLYPHNWHQVIPISYHIHLLTTNTNLQP